MTFWQQLSERRMFRIVAAYLAGGWVVLQVFDQLMNRGMLPDFVYPLVLTWYLIGIPVAIILGWYHGEKGQQRATKLEVVLLLAMVAVGVGASSVTVSDEVARRVLAKAAAESQLDLRRIAVLYFDDHSVNSEVRHVADGFSEALIDELTAVRELRVVSRNGVAPFRDAGVRRDSIARVLGAGTIVAGSVEQAGDRVRVNVRLLDGESGAEFRRAVFERPAGELLRARDDLVGRTAVMLREWLGQEVRLRQTHEGTASVAAWAVYQRADRARKDGEQALAHGDRDATLTAFGRADSLLEQAETLDALWAEPAAMRAHLAFRTARFIPGARPRIEIVQRGLVHAERALALEPNHARALEARGTLYYWHYLQDVEEPARQAVLLRHARQDLERAIELDPRLASAHATLSHLHLNQGDEPSAILASRRALEEDAWLDNADVVMFRLATGNYNLERFDEARRWCRTGRERFPGDYRFAACELLLMTTPAVDADVERAWSLLQDVEALAPPQLREWQQIRGQLLVGGVIARAGLADSARSVWVRAREQVTPAVDPVQWMLFQEAHMRTLVGDYDQAIDLLKRYAAVNPGTSFEHNWWWRELRRQPRYREIATHTH